MLQPADLLLLDEPTNDLDIPTLEILEESLLEYRGALVLVTHDRYMLDRVSTVVLGLDGWGEIERFADYSQWDSLAALAGKRPRQSSRRAISDGRSRAGNATQPPAHRKKLSYGEAREFATIEKRIAEEEEKLGAMRAALEDPAIVADRLRLQNACLQVEEAQKAVDRLYARWAELEQRQAERLLEKRRCCGGARHCRPMRQA